MSTVEHSITPLDAVRPWRTAAVVLSLVAAVELVVIVAAGAALLARPVAAKAKEIAVGQAPAPQRSSDPAPRAPGAKAPRLPRSETSVLVLNGNGVTGAASSAAGRLRMVGYLVGGVGNAPGGEYPRTLVMYRTGYRGEALRLARDLKLRVVGPLDGLKPRELMGAHLALVLGER